MQSRAIITGSALALIAASSAVGQTTATFNQPTFDRWNYPFGPGGTRDTMSTFGAFVPGQFDDRDAQALVSYATGANFTPGLGAQNYIITSARVVAANVTDNVIAYDPTQDSFRSSLDPSDPDFVADADTGVPVEIYATGFRPPFSAFSYGETGPFAFGPPTGEGIRNAFAADIDGSGQLRDVSNNVTDRFETNPFAVGQTNLNPGDLIPSGTEFTFDLDVSNPDIAAYIANGLDAGIVSFSISSLHAAGFGGPPSFPAFFTKESTDPNASPVQFIITAEIIPAPASMGVLALGVLGATRRRR